MAAKAGVEGLANQMVAQLAAATGLSPQEIAKARVNVGDLEITVETPEAFIPNPTEAK